MSVRNNKLGGNDWYDGEILYSKDLNDTFDKAVDWITPVGSVIEWDKKLFSICSGTTTSTATNKLIDSNATFITSGVKENMCVYPTAYSNSAETSTTSTTYVLVKTIYDFGNTSKGFFIDNITNEINGTDVNSWTYCKMKYYYIDGTTADNEEYHGVNIYSGEAYNNPNPSKKVYKVEVYLKTRNAGNTAYERNDVVHLVEDKTSVSNIDSETQLSVEDNIFVINGISYYIYATPKFNDNWVECEGQVLNDSESIFDGLTMPDNPGYIIRVK